MPARPADLVSRARGREHGAGPGNWSWRSYRPLPSTRWPARRSPSSPPRSCGHPVHRTPTPPARPPSRRHRPAHLRHRGQPRGRIRGAERPDVGLTTAGSCTATEVPHHRPIPAGDRLVATTTIDAARTVAGNDLLTARVTYDRGRRAGLHGDLHARGAWRMSRPTGATDPPSVRNSRAGLPCHARRPGPLRRASGDFNPIHWNERWRPRSACPRIAHGWFTMAIAVRVVTAWAGTPGGLEYNVLSPALVVPNDDRVAEVTVHARSARPRRTPAAHRSDASPPTS